MTPSRPFLIGLTGGIACGKSHVTDVLRRLGAGIIDADGISRALTAPGGAALPRIRERFGEAVFSDGELDRAGLARTVFGDPANLAALNGIMHPMVFEEMERQILALCRYPALIADVPLLYETGYDVRCDEVWCVWAPEEAQIQRLLRRGLGREEALARIRSQMPSLEKARRADHVLVTTGSKEDTAQAVTRLWEECVRRIGRG